MEKVIIHLHYLMRYIMEQNNLFDLYKEEDFNFAENTTIKYGDLFKLGKHFLMCGDATNKNDVLKLMNEKKADMIFTDPPYNVDYEGAAGKIQNDKNER